MEPCKKLAALFGAMDRAWAIVAAKIPMISKRTSGGMWIIARPPFYLREPSSSIGSGDSTQFTNQPIMKRRIIVYDFGRVDTASCMILRSLFFISNLAAQPRVQRQLLYRR